MGELKFSTLDATSVKAARDKFRTPKVINPLITAIHNLTSLAFGWQDFCVIGEKMVFFVASSDEDHANMDGSIKVVNMSTWTVETSILHNLGHVNTVHYDADSDVLMIGNLPGSATTRAAIYLLYSFSTLLTGNINFTTIDKTVVDISALGINSWATASCFGESNFGVRNIAYVSGQYNSYWWKLIFGMATNNLGAGTYSAAAAGKYNGTYKVLFATTFAGNGDPNDEVIQGIDFYKGQVITSNGHNMLQGAIWNFSPDNYVTKNMIQNGIYTAAGVALSCISEGLTVYNDIVYQGVQGDYAYVVEYKL